MSRIVLVDEDDNEIGHKERSEKLKTPGIYRIAALWLTNSHGDVLLAKRSTKKENESGLWGPAAAGTVEEGETYESNIIKEAEEEIGLSGVEFQKAWKKPYGPHRRYFVQFFTATTDKKLSDFQLQAEEVEQVKWFTKEDLIFAVQQHPEDFVGAIPDCIERFLLLHAN
jgi:isopentenyldiphosphate isomerase